MASGEVQRPVDVEPIDLGPIIDAPFVDSVHLSVRFEGLDVPYERLPDRPSLAARFHSLSPDVT